MTLIEDPTGFTVHHDGKVVGWFGPERHASAQARAMEATLRCNLDPHRPTAAPVSSQGELLFYLRSAGHPLTVEALAMMACMSKREVHMRMGTAAARGKCVRVAPSTYGMPA